MKSSRFTMSLAASLCLSLATCSDQKSASIAQQERTAEEIMRQNREIYEESAILDGSVSSVTFALTTDQGSWFKGDLHAHSTYSDGDSDVGTVVHIAEDSGLDFFTITDHNTSAQWSDPGFRSTKLSLLYGTEWTTGNGHANIWASAPYDYESSIRPTLVEGVVAATQAVGNLRAAGEHILFSINHPDDPFSGSWRYTFAESQHVDCMEVWNGLYTWPSLSFLVIDGIFKDYWRQGARLCMVGGSDSHTHKLDNIETYYNNIGMPTTWVLAASKAAADILDGLKSGITFVSSEVNGAQIRFSADTAGGRISMGQNLPAAALGRKATFNVSIANAKTLLGDIFPYSLTVVMKNGRPFRFTLNSHSDYGFGFSDTPIQGDFYYARLIQLPSEVSVWLLSQLLQIGQVKALSSPIAAR